MATPQAIKAYLLYLSAAKVKNLGRVTSLDIYDGISNNFNEDGLFSETIFGVKGTVAREERFGYIDLNTEIIHPLIFRKLIKLKAFYGDIVAGKKFAIFDEKLKDFVPSSPLEKKASTGYAFFYSRYRDITHTRNKSIKRNVTVNLIEKYKDVSDVRYMPVSPAIFRDIEVDAEGNRKEGELNDYYRAILSIANTLYSSNRANSPQYDTQRLALQNAVQRLYDVISDMLYGKKGFILAKFASRTVVHGTSNVISAMDTNITRFGDPSMPTIHTSQIGMLQMAKGALPLTIHKLKESVLRDVFQGIGRTTYLINPKTLKPELTEVSEKVKKKWYSYDGLEELIDLFVEVERRNQPITIEGRYLALVYADDRYFKVFRDIDELPSGWDRKNVHPMTMMELFYLSNYIGWYDQFGFGTRFPVSEQGSTYPTQFYLRTTVESYQLMELDEQWQPRGADYVAKAFPRWELGAPFFDTFSPHAGRLKGLGGDFDGDTMAVQIMQTEEAREEIRAYLKTPESLVSLSGKKLISVGVDTIDLVLKALLTNVD